MPGTPIQGISAGVSWVDVCNTALRAIGAARISNLTDGSPSQLACSDLLGDAITAVMAANDDWCILRVRTQLTRDPKYVPPNDYLYAYTLPSDCSDFQQDGVEAIDQPPSSNPLVLPNGSPSNHKWSREGNWILTDATLVYLLYQRNLNNEDPSILPDWFFHAIHDQLAVGLCMPLRQNVALLRILEKAAEKSLQAAIANDDKAKETWEGSKTRGYDYYEKVRMTGFDGLPPDPYRSY
jgi:hypothetical protein